MEDPKIKYLSLKASEPGLLVECIRNVYGDSYPVDEFYDVGFIAAQINKGLLHSEVAVNEAGEAVGNICTHLEQVGDYTADGSVTMVDVRYRGRGIMGELGLRSTEVYRKLGICGIHIYALAWHEIVQKQSAAGGAFEMGILPGYFSSDIETQNFKRQGVRLGSVMMYLPLSSLPGTVVYFPEAYKEALLLCYDAMKGQRQIRMADAAVVMPDKTYCNHYENLKNSYQLLRIHRLGADCKSMVADFNRNAKELEVSYLDISLNNPNVDAVTRLAREMGFFFGGVLIERCGSDFLRLQKVRPNFIDPANLSIASHRGRQLLEIILKDRG